MDWVATQEQMDRSSVYSLGYIRRIEREAKEALKLEKYLSLFHPQSSLQWVLPYVREEQQGETD